MWRFDFGGGVELYDARARMWSPKLGTFLSVDEFAWHDSSTTLWGWPGQNAIRWGDPFGRGRGAEDGRGGFDQFLFDINPSSFYAAAGFGTGLLDNVPIYGVPGSPTLGDVSALLGLAGQRSARPGACAGGGDNGDNDAANAGRLAGGIAGALVLARGGAGPGKVGKAGEDAVRRVVDIGPKVAIRVGERTRIPDGLTNTVLSEVKNLASVSYTQQLRDFAQHAAENGLRFDLYVRPTSVLSGPLLEAIGSGAIDLRFIP